MNRVLRVAAAILTIAAIASVAGCSSNPETDPASKKLGLKNTASQAPPGQNATKTGAAIPNVDPVPAPEGVKTGLEGGRK